MSSFSVDSTKRETYGLELTSMTKENIRYNAERMILQDSCSRYSGEEAVLHAPLEANDSYIWRGLPDPSKQVGESRVGQTDHFDVHLHLADGDPGCENAGDGNQSHHS